MRAVDVIRKKRDGQALTVAEIQAFVQAATHKRWPDYQVSALLMAIVLRGMDEPETAALTAAMVASGVRLDLSDIPGRKADKHSTGGVGDKTSLILAPLAAACGVIVPMMSGRGLGHSGGTLDKLEAIPGFRVSLSLDELRRSLERVGCALISQTAEIAPADRALYALRDVTATVESLPLIASSIMSKKIAEGIEALVMDVKCGQGAFLKTRAEAQQLARMMVAIGRDQGVRVRALLTRMDTPLGRAVGNSLEVIESLEVLKGRGPADLTDLSVLLAAHVVQLAGLAGSVAESEQQVSDALVSGRGLEKFRQIVANQGGDPAAIDDYGRLPTAPSAGPLSPDGRGSWSISTPCGSVRPPCCSVPGGSEPRMGLIRRSGSWSWSSPASASWPGSRCWNCTIATSKSWTRPWACWPRSVALVMSRSPWSRSCWRLSSKPKFRAQAESAQSFFPS